ncbi:hypothetical protein [Nostoc sp. FACHB-888]|uniref:hypothetical protein n=1 Tax=Nostoc sp. FACHB-888 TaxID=2692842 RepID=UPI0016873B6C|nr:hypothetical protein [Nostoc sp. FACHB-888]MBD2245213.1 hypothetical protein [Nostoc sp. FACHB-888]
MVKKIVFSTISLLLLGVGLTTNLVKADPITVGAVITVAQVNAPIGSTEGASDASVYYPLNEQLESFFVGNDGAVNLLYKANNAEWQAPVKLTAPKFAPPRGNITAVYYPLNDQLEVFAVGNDGAVNVIWKEKNGPWNAPAPISSPKFAPPGANITAVYYPLNDQLEVFAVGNNGAVNVIWKENNGPWKVPGPISLPKFAPPGAGITAAYYPLNDQLEVFAVGNNGAVNVIWKENNGPWKVPGPISSPNFAPPGANITAAYYPLNDQLEVFAVGNNGAVNVIWKENNGPWKVPGPISSPNFAPPGANITAAYYPLNDQLEVFAVGNNGAVNVIWKENNGPWKVPGPISSPNFALPGGS